ncbi:hypothetical protein [Hymenobacter guriensis]|uniref:Lipoprotein n=1 Tax=Hymenobacter guriensis TaxID=2793065 RepID=A0ABS0L1G2_9BACT|nr:hypothetical protein [Hymenobacter guriensis]MBG8553908.1 hypothetical protein [Hymenobacter guriensis]
MYITRFFQLLFVVGMMSGCYCPGAKEQQKLVELTNTARSWLPRSGAQTAVFQNSSGEQQTLRLTSYTDSVEEKFLGDECPEGRQEVIRGRWASAAWPDSITITIINGTYVISESASVFVNYHSDKQQIGTNAEFYETAIYPSITLNGRVFSDVVTSKCRSCKDPKNQFTTLYVAKAQGPVGLYVGGSLWVRQ